MPAHESATHHPSAHQAVEGVTTKRKAVASSRRLVPLVLVLLLRWRRLHERVIEAAERARAVKRARVVLRGEPSHPIVIVTFPSGAGGSTA